LTNSTTYARTRSSEPYNSLVPWVWHRVRVWFTQYLCISFQHQDFNQKKIDFVKTLWLLICYCNDHVMTFVAFNLWFLVWLCYGTWCLYFVALSLILLWWRVALFFVLKKLN
jgi:hypothetical protein